MRFNKETLVAGLALFSMFFGAGNLMLPPFLGFKSGESWYIVVIGFVLSAVIIPLLGIFAHAKIQGTMRDFANKVSPTFSLVYCILIYTISIALPSPRTASVTHEMAIQPFLGTSAWVTSLVYFSLVLIFVINRSRVLDVLGKFLSPIIFVVILCIIFIGVFSVDIEIASPSLFQNPFVDGLLEGYQTFDAIGAVVVGGVIIVSLKIKGKNNHKENRSLIIKSGILAGIGLLIIYTGMIYSGALFASDFDADITRTVLLSGLSQKTLGSIGHVFLSVLVGLACFTTAVGIITGTSDFMKGLFHESNTVYYTTAVVGCILGVVMGQFDVHYIINIAIPALMLIYPVTIVLILLNSIPSRFTSLLVFRMTIVVTMLFSIPDFLGSIGMKSSIAWVVKNTPLGTYNLAWFFPALFTLVVTNLWIVYNKKKPLL